MLLQLIAFAFGNPFWGGAARQAMHSRLDGFRTFAFNTGAPAQDTFTRSGM